MASGNCWRCLARPSQHRLLLAPAASASAPFPSASAIVATAPFTTSAAQLAAPLKPKNKGKGKDVSMTRHIRAGKQLTLGRKKKPRESRGRPIAPGERKAFRKRIQLSNDNAIEVPGLPELSKTILADPKAIGQVASLPGPLIDQLRAIEAFKPKQNWSLFRSPHVLIRNETVDLVNQLTDAVAKKQTLRTVIDGDKGSGKSILNLQLMSAAMLNDYVVIHIPEAQDLTTARTDYSPIADSNLYSLPSYTVKLMQAIHKSNPILSKHMVEGDHLNLPVAVPHGSPLSSMISATKEPEFAWPVFKAFWQELLRPGRPPVVFTLDGLVHMMRLSEYRNPALEFIHSHDISLIGLFADALGGKTKFPNGGAVIGVATKNNNPTLPAYEKAIEQAAAAQKGLPIPPRDLYSKKNDERVFESLKGVKVHEVRGLSKPEARSLLEYWAASGMMRAKVNEYNVSDKWTMAGGGIVAEMERVVLNDNRMAI